MEMSNVSITGRTLQSSETARMRGQEAHNFWPKPCWWSVWIPIAYRTSATRVNAGKPGSAKHNPSPLWNGILGSIHALGKGIRKADKKQRREIMVHSVTRSSGSASNMHAVNSWRFGPRVHALYLFSSSSVPLLRVWDHICRKEPTVSSMVSFIL